MISLKYLRTNPIDNFKSIYSSYGKLSEYKFWEIDFYQYNWYWFEFELELRTSGFDHAGPEVCIGILGYYINFKIYDSRHWDKKLDNWSNDDYKKLK